MIVAIIRAFSPFSHFRLFLRIIFITTFVVVGPLSLRFLLCDALCFNIDFSYGFNWYKSQLLAFTYIRTNGVFGNAIQFPIWFRRSMYIVLCALYVWYIFFSILLLSAFSFITWMSHPYIHPLTQTDRVRGRDRERERKRKKQTAYIIIIWGRHCSVIDRFIFPK